MASQAGELSTYTGAVVFLLILLILWASLHMSFRRLVAAMLYAVGYGFAFFVVYKGVDTALAPPLYLASELGVFMAVAGLAGVVALVASTIKRSDV